MNSQFEFFKKFIQNESFSGVLLFVATILAVIVANSSFSQSYFELWNTPLGMAIGSHTISMNIKYWIDDGLMAIFFLMVGLEIKRELLVGGLSSKEKASFPIIAALGGMIIPALIYVIFNSDNPRGFGIPMATDIAFALGILMLLGDKVSASLKLFLVALAVVDDLGAVFVVATVYTSEIHSIYFLYSGIVYALIWLLNYKKVTSLLPYIILGLFLWFYIHAIGIHATIAGVLLAFAIPIKSSVDEKEFVKCVENSTHEFGKNIDDVPLLNHHQIDALEDIAYNYDKVQNPLVKLEHQLHGLSAFVIMPIFAFSNAGVILDFSAISSNLMIVLGVVVGLIIGKPLGIVGFTWAFDKLKIVPKPHDLAWSEVVAVGFLGGIGFTMSIFITQLAFLDDGTIGAVKLGIFFASFISAVIGVLLILKGTSKK
jgi:NhaA family Na+:H+ antiporter